MSATIVLADTNVISEFVRSTPDAQVMRWLRTVPLMAISATTLEEAHFGLGWQPNTRKLALFNALVDRLQAVYPITPAIAQRGSAERLASWVGICPGNNESAGKRKSGKIRKGNAWVRRLLCEFARGRLRVFPLER